jgi:hypothetical protein
MKKIMCATTFSMKVKPPMPMAKRAVATRMVLGAPNLATIVFTPNTFTPRPTIPARGKGAIEKMWGSGKLGGRMTGKLMNIW